MTSRRNQPLKKHIEIHAESPFVITEERAELRISRVPMHLQRVEMIRQVEAPHGEAEGVFVIHFEILRDARVKREEIREAQCVRRSDVVARGVKRRIGKAIAIFDYR